MNFLRCKEDYEREISIEQILKYPIREVDPEEKSNNEKTPI
jgi:hypothetical protein